MQIVVRFKNGDRYVLDRAQLRIIPKISVEGQVVVPTQSPTTSEPTKLYPKATVSNSIMEVVLSAWHKLPKRFVTETFYIGEIEMETTTYNESTGEFYARGTGPNLLGL